MLNDVGIRQKKKEHVTLTYFVEQKQLWEDEISDK